MENRENAALLVTELMLRHMTFGAQHFCDGSAGKIHTSFGYVVSGSTHITIDALSLDLREGSFFFLPAGIHYRSEWTGAPKIEYYMLHMTLTQNYLQNYMPAKIEALSGHDTLKTIKDIECGLTADEAGQLAAMERFYRLFSKAFPHLTEWTEHHKNPVISKAVDYIRENIDRDMPMAELARTCFLSESRLYHIFKKELGISPLQLRNELRINQAISMMKGGHSSTEDILIKTGFSSAAYFRKIFKEQTGMTPSEYEKLIKK